MSHFSLCLSHFSQSMSQKLRLSGLFNSSFWDMLRRMPDAGCRMPDAGCRMPDATTREGYSRVDLARECALRAEASVISFRAKRTSPREILFPPGGIHEKWDMHDEKWDMHGERTLSR